MNGVEGSLITNTLCGVWEYCTADLESSTYFTDTAEDISFQEILGNKTAITNDYSHNIKYRT